MLASEKLFGIAYAFFFFFLIEFVQISILKEERPPSCDCFNYRVCQSEKKIINYLFILQKNSFFCLP